MRLVAVIPKEDLVSLVEALTPMRIVIDERQGRTVTLGRPNLIELVPERGLRIRGAARIMWDVAGVPIPITVNGWQVLLIPRVVARERGTMLALEPVVEQFDLKRVPGFIDDRIAGAVRGALEAQREKLAWNFARSLTKRLTLPLKIGPARVFEIAALEAGISVSQTEMRLAVSFETRIEKERIDKERIDKERIAGANADMSSAGTPTLESGRPRPAGPPSSRRRPERRPTLPRMR